MATNPNPVRISAASWRFWQEFLEFEPTVKLGGIYSGSKGGYHNARENLPFGDATTDYSVNQVALDRQGPSQYGAAIDMTLSDPAKMRLYSARLDRAMRARDPRLFIDGEPVVREFIGTLNSTSVYCYVLTGGRPLGVGADSGPDPGRDDSHLWHIHLSVIRKFCATWRAYSGILSILKNEPYESWEYSMPTADEIAEAVWSYPLKDGYLKDADGNPVEKSAGAYQRYANSKHDVLAVGLKVDAVAGAVAALDVVDDADRAAIAAQILAGLPTELARQVAQQTVDELAARIAPTS